MQVIYKNEVEEGSSRGADLVCTVIYTRRVSRYLEGKCARGFERRRTRV